MMNKWMMAGVTGLTALALLSGCQQEDKETKRQLAELQAQLEAEKAEKAKREAKEREQQQLAQQQAREDQIRQETEEAVRAQLKMEAEAKAAKQKAQATKATPTVTEKVVRYPATVVTQSGYGDLSLRGEASTKGLEIGKVYDGDEVTVIARTSKCEVIGKIEGCWVKVQLKENNVKGYMFDGYLQREVLSQEEKAKLQGQSESETE